MQTYSFLFSLTLNFWELVRVRLFSPNFASTNRLGELRRSSRHDSAVGPRPRTYGEGNAPLTTPLAAYLPTFLRRRAAIYQRARTLAPNRRRGNLLCSDFSEHTRPLRSAGDGPPGLRQVLASSPAATSSLWAGVS